ncbi:hypothetical protein H5410_049115 [Solanum commersonii]|uniref:Cytochrome P450 n=1 Tax=Solanum commersonii TaxID=4109 RepID=A0A9J5XK65_SOLCO|nr:hypothetical protein H5410_049115 [Solanum commersonii]
MCGQMVEIPASWEDPLVFKPERICPGLPLATLRMVPVMLGSLLISFDWKLEEATSTPKELDMEEKFGITLAKARPLRAIPSPI